MYSWGKLINKSHFQSNIQLEQKKTPIWCTIKMSFPQVLRNPTWEGHNVKSPWSLKYGPVIIYGNIQPWDTYHPFLKVRVWVKHLLVCLSLIFIFLSSEFSSAGGEQKYTASSFQQPDHPRWTAGQPYLHCLQQEHTGPHCTPSTLQGTYSPHLYIKGLFLCGWNQFTPVFLKGFCIPKGCGIRRPDAVWHHALGRKKYKYFLEQPTSLTGAGRSARPTRRTVCSNISSVVTAITFLQRFNLNWKSVSNYSITFVHV